MKNAQLYKAMKLDPGHVLDGRFEKDDWQGVDTFELVDTESGGAPHQRTWAKLGWTDTHLWAAFHCEDTAIETRLTEHDHPDLWTENVVELFLDPLRSRHIYYELQVNAGNVGFDGLIHLASGAEGVGAGGGMQCFRDWNPETYQHVVTGKGKFDGRSATDECWDVELSIAFEEFYMIGQAPPKPHDQWLFNAFRVDSGPWGQRLYAWSPTLMPNFHVSSRFAVIEFLDQRP